MIIRKGFSKEKLSYKKFFKQNQDNSTYYLIVNFCKIYQEWENVTLTKYQANQIQTKVESSVQPIEIKKELINSLWQKLEQDKTDTPRIYSDNALNYVLEGLGYDAYDLMLPAFNTLPNAQAQVPAYNYVDKNDALGTMELESMLDRGGFNDIREENNQFNTTSAEQGNAFNSLDDTQANVNYFSPQMESLFEQFSHFKDNLYDRFYKVKFLQYYADGNLDMLDLVINHVFKAEERKNVTEQIISLRDSCYRKDQSCYNLKQKPVVDETQLISGVVGI